MNSINARNILIALGTVLLSAYSLPTFARGDSSPPMISALMPGSAETTDYVIIDDARGLENGRIVYCAERSSFSISTLSTRCLAKGSMTPQEALAKVAPPRAILTGLAPVLVLHSGLSSKAEVRGFVLYYKRAPE